MVRIKVATSDCLPLPLLLGSLLVLARLKDCSPSDAAVARSTVAAKVASETIVVHFMSGLWLYYLKDVRADKICFYVYE